MLEQLVGQFLGSGSGADLVAQLGAKGLTPQQAQGAVTATAEGAMAQGGDGLSAMLGGGAGGLGGMLGGLAGALGGAPAAPAASGASPLTALIPVISTFVAQKTGMAPAMAQTVVSLALPKLMEFMTAQKSAAPAGGGLGGLFS